MRGKKPNYNYAQQAARALLQKHNMSKLPVNIRSIIHSQNDITMVTYQEAQKRFNCTEKEIIESVGSKDGTLQYANASKEYLIIYNENVVSQEKMRWTLAHELGHYILGHLDNVNTSIINEDGLTKTEYYILESEANAFTRELLAPPPVLRALDVFDVQSISQLCGLSPTASKQVKNFLKKGKDEYNIRYYEDNPIKILFSDFISQKKMTNPSENEPKIITKCPRCINDIEQQDSSYCIYCGIYLINKCTGIDINAEEYRKQTMTKIGRAHV